MSYGSRLFCFKPLLSTTLSLEALLSTTLSLESENGADEIIEIRNGQEGQDSVQHSAVFGAPGAYVEHVQDEP